MVAGYTFSTVCMGGDGIPVGDSQCNQEAPIQFVDGDSQLKFAINNCSITGVGADGKPTFDNAAGGCPGSLGPESLGPDMHCLHSQTWSDWSACSTKCDTGIQTRTQAIARPARGSGSCNGGVEHRKCNTQACVNECTITPWTDWTACSRVCGGGEQSRSRSATGGDPDDISTCFERDANGDKKRLAMGNMHQTQECNTELCVGPGECACSGAECPWRAVPGRPLNGHYDGSVNGKVAIKSSIHDAFFRAEWQRANPTRANPTGACKQVCDKAGGNMVVMNSLGLGLGDGQHSCNCYKNDECLQWDHTDTLVAGARFPTHYETFLKNDSYPCEYGVDDTCHRTS